MPNPAPVQASPLSDAIERLQLIRHACAYVLAIAVQRLFTEVKVTVGPLTETGFYYNFDCPTPFTPADLERIEAEMPSIIQADLPIIQETVDREAIKTEIEQLNEPYKLEILDSIPEDKTITRYFIGCPIWIRDGAHKVMQIRGLIASNEWEQHWQSTVLQA